MSSPLPKINPGIEKNKIISFIKSVLKKQGFQKVVIGVSGGVDSTTCLYLLKKAMPEKNILAVSLPYFQTTCHVKYKYMYKISIKSAVDQFIKVAGVEGKGVPVITGAKNTDSQHMSRVAANYRNKLKPTSLMHVQEDVFEPLKKIRLGNIMARVRMIILFDLAKKHNALVCGTENKTEHLLGYYTRFGDEASDIEPIRHLYKTQVYQLAKYLDVPKEIINQRPTAGLWSGQTDEAEFGFSYEEADQVLYLVYDRGVDIKKVIKMGYKNAQKIIAFAKKNAFKHQAPYTL